MTIRLKKMMRLTTALFFLTLAACAISVAYADDATDQEAQSDRHKSPEPGWYIMVAAGALVPASFYLRRRIEAKRNG